MFVRSILTKEIIRSNLFQPSCLVAHSGIYSCRVVKKQQEGDAKNASGILRAERSGPVRLGFIPEEWFQFFYNKTGVTGPYFLLLGLTNYAVSKEIYVMEHEYYSGLSVALVLYLVTTRLGPKIGASLDKEVDAISAEFVKIRNDETNFYKNTIVTCKDGIWRAHGQKLLMDAKKENVAIQLETAYRERLLYAFLAVRDRMDYQIKKQSVLFRIHQKWMIQWILLQVRRSITPDFKKQALNSAIGELSEMSAASQK